MNRAKPNLTAAKKSIILIGGDKRPDLRSKTAKNPKTFNKYALAKKGYEVISVDSRKGYEYVGVVNIIAVKREEKDPDKLQYMLVQVKGGSAEVSFDEIRRLRKAIDTGELFWRR